MEEDAEEAKADKVIDYILLWKSNFFRESL